MGTVSFASTAGMGGNQPLGSTGPGSEIGLQRGVAASCRETNAQHDHEAGLSNG